MTQSSLLRRIVGSHSALTTLVVAGSIVWCSEQPQSSLQRASSEVTGTIYTRLPTTDAIDDSVLIAKAHSRTDFTATSFNKGTRSVDDSQSYFAVLSSEFPDSNVLQDFVTCSYSKQEDLEYISFRSTLTDKEQFRIHFTDQGYSGAKMTPQMHAMCDLIRRHAAHPRTISADTSLSRIG